MLELFWDRMSGFTVDENNCWLWPNVNSTLGYGLIGVTRKYRQYAHRVFYYFFVDDLIPGMTIDHLCRNRACVNPEHLEQVTLAENKRRGRSPAALNAHKETCRYNHYAYRVKYNGKRECIECKKRYDREHYLRQRQSHG